MNYFIVRFKKDHPTNKGVKKDDGCKIYRYGVTKNSNSKYQLCTVGYHGNKDVDIYCSYEWDEKDLIIEKEYKRDERGFWI